MRGEVKGALVGAALVLAVVFVCCAKPVRAGRDYYALLGVERDAPEGVIKRAYRKLTAKWHPDRHNTEQEKQRAQKKFICSMKG